MVYFGIKNVIFFNYMTKKKVFNISFFIIYERIDRL